jgi:hypothetical protein
MSIQKEKLEEMTSIVQSADGSVPKPTKGQRAWPDSCRIDGGALKVLSLTDSQEKKDRMLEVLSKHLHAQIFDVSEILTAHLY